LPIGIEILEIHLPDILGFEISPDENDRLQNGKEQFLVHEVKGEVDRSLL
jgi:hypothetical protein